MLKHSLAFLLLTLAPVACGPSASLLKMDGGTQNLADGGQDTCPADLATNRSHCGQCKKACAGSEDCVVGECVPSSDCRRNLLLNCTECDQQTGECRQECTRDSDCQAPANGTVQCVNDRCLTSCDTGYQVCELACCKVSGCGNLNDCPQPTNGSAQCVSQKCETSCNTGYSPCASGCCQDSSGPCPPGELSCGGSCCGAVSISSGQHHSCVVLTSGGVACWGENNHGQLGNGAHTPADVDAQRDNRHLANPPVEVVGLSNVKAVAAGSEHTCAITQGGEVKCWGRNHAGQLGLGAVDSQNHSTPVTVPGLSGGYLALAAGADHTCAVSSAGAVKCWGANGRGELGDDGSMATEPSPRDVVGASAGAVAITSLGQTTCVLTSGNGIKCWGWNGYGQIGAGASTGFDDARRSALQVQGLASGAQSVAAGLWHTCAVTSAGAAKCWGLDGFGQLGDGAGKSWSAQPVPQDVAGLSMGVKQIVGGTVHTCAVTGSYRNVQCWGQSGELGPVAYPETPTLVPGLTGVKMLSAGSEFSCAVLDDGKVKCWGKNDYGKLGDGTTQLRQTPAAVSSP